MIETPCATPETVTVPEVGFAAYPVTLPTVYGYDPFASVKAIVLVVEDFVVPAKVTDQEVPLGRPLSVKVTAYGPGATAVKVIGTDCALPATVTVPDAGDAVYPVTVPIV